MADKQPHLNGAYYGPSIPAPQHSNHHRGCGGRGCCCCLFSILWKILLGIVILVGLAILIFWLVVQPREFKFYVSEASLTQFDYNNNGTLHYNLALNITIRNPNKNLGYYIDDVQGRAYYEGQRFSTTNVTTWQTAFRLRKKTTAFLNGTFKGQQLMLLGTEQVSEYNKEKASGVYSIDARFHMEIRFRLGDFITGTSKPKVKCGLKVPLTNAAQSTVGFEPKKCDVNF